MRVLFLYPRTLDAAHSTGGVAEFLCQLTPALASMGVDSVIYAGDKTTTTLFTPAQTIAHANVYNGPFIKPGWFYSRKKLKPILDLCKREHFDVIHAQGTYTAGFMARQISKRTGIPYVVTSHSDILTLNSKRMRRRNVKNRCRDVLKDAAAVTHLTPMMETVSHELWDTRNKSTVIGNGIDCASWRAYGDLPERPYLLALGRLERGKGFHVLIDMYAQLVKQGVTSSLIIAGKGGEEANLRKQVQQLGLNCVTEFTNTDQLPDQSVIFAGYVRDDAKMRLIAQSQCVLFATQPDLWEEAFGIVQLEAMAAGKPIIASDTNVTRYLQQQAGLNVLSVPPADIEAWVTQMKRLLNDEALRQACGKANLQAAHQFDWLPIAKQYLSVFARVAKP